jgi:hypothetical protein
MAPGSIEGLQMVVDNAEASRKELADRGVEVSDIEVFPWGISSSSRIQTAMAGPCRKFHTGMRDAEDTPQREQRGWSRRSLTKSEGRSSM